jgi:glycosyltransferase involved in cell wall biosynthesis
VFTGRLVRSKGLPTLLRAWRQVIAQRPDALLLLVGAGGLDMHNCEAELRDYVREHGLESSVRFAGAVNNVHEYLQASDLFVFPSEREAFGISVIEAMASGLPVVSTAVDGIRDVIRPGIDATVVPPRDEAALAAALARVLALDETIVAMAAAGRARALAEFSSDSVVEAYRAMLAALVRG